MERYHFQWPWTISNPDFKVIHSVTLNILETAKDMAIVVIERE